MSNERGRGRGVANQQSPLLESSPQPPNSRTRNVEQMGQETQRQHPNRCFTIFVDLINMLMCTAEIALVLYLTEHHYRESMGVIAIVMLAPILLNFVGVTYFFSDNNERMEFERVGTTRFTRDMLQVPVLGPVFTAIKVLMISTGISSRPDIEYERFESCAVKMRESQTFFSAAPEAVVQLAVLLNTSATSINLNHILEILVVVVSIFTLAEGNVYALRSNYFKLFHTYEPGDWNVHETFGRKCILFFHSFFSIASRVAASACLIASAQCYFRGDRDDNTMMRMPRPRNRPPSSQSNYDWYNPSFEREPEPARPQAETAEDIASTQQLGFIIGVTLVCLILYHMLIYYVARVLRYTFMGRDVPGGCYESVNYGWRSTILHTGFQSRNIATQFWFYVENCIMFTLWWFSVEKFGTDRVKRNSQLPMTLIFTVFTVLSLFLMFAAVGAGLHRLESPFRDNQGQQQTQTQTTDQTQTQTQVQQPPPS